MWHSRVRCMWHSRARVLVGRSGPARSASASGARQRDGGRRRGQGSQPMLKQLCPRIEYTDLDGRRGERRLQRPTHLLDRHHPAQHAFCVDGHQRPELAQRL
jgi:hypothetical protein